MAISIKDAARFYADLSTQNKGLDLLQLELSKLGLTADSCQWVTEYRKESEAPIALPGKSIAAKESERVDFTGVVNWQNPNCYISKYFTVGEVTQHDRRRIPQKGSLAEVNILRLGYELDKVRDAYGYPIGVTSWHRPRPINAEVGGVFGSKHESGLAADIYPMSGGNIHDFQRWLDGRWLDALGYGAKKGFVHVDIRGGGGLNRVGKEGKVRWNY